VVLNVNSVLTTSARFITSTARARNFRRICWQAKRDFYAENMAQFREAQRQLETIVTSETLKAIQDEVDTNVEYLFAVSCFARKRRISLHSLHGVGLLIISVYIRLYRRR
jgi:hypothetical protein